MKGPALSQAGVSFWVIKSDRGKVNRVTMSKDPPPRYPAGKLFALFCCMLAGMFFTTVTAAAGDDFGPNTTTNHAQPLSKVLDLQKCIDIAIANNHSRKASRLGIEIAEAQHKQALSAYWPQVGIKANYTIMDEDPDFIFPANTVNVTTVQQTASGPITVTMPASVSRQDIKLMDRENLYATVGATLPLYTGGKISSIVRQSEQGVRAASEEARRTDLQVIYDVARFYYGVVLAGELLQIGRDTLARMEVTLELTESLYTKGSGRVKKTDYLRNKTVVEWLRSAVSELEANHELAKAALTNTMGIDWDSNIVVADTNLPYVPFSAGLSGLVNDACSFNPDWQRLQAGLEAAKAKITEAGSGHFPKIGLFGNFTHIQNSYEAGIVTPSNRNSWTVGVGLELPVFNGLRTTNEVLEASARLRKLKEQQSLLRDGIALQVKDIFIRMMKTQKQKEYTQEAALSAGENRSLNERAYREGLVETKDVIEAQFMESLMRAQYQKALYDHLEAGANLDFVVGKRESGLADVSR
jgi:outer membrane protein